MAPICMFCYHLQKDKFTCRAYPNGIPKEILGSVVDHRKSYKDDNGIQFLGKLPLIYDSNIFDKD